MALHGHGRCDNGTEVRYKDIFFEKLVSQILKDYLAKIDLGENKTAQISQSDPCTDGAIDPLSGPFNKSFSGSLYEATIEIYNIKVIQELFLKNENS